MTTPSDYEIARAQRFGRGAANAGRAVESCPFNANGTPAQRVLAARWVAAYLAAKPTSGEVDYSG